MQHSECKEFPDFLSGRVFVSIGKFLRIFFGCHARPDRSFYFRGRQFPICARCTGELLGMIAGIPLAAIAGCPSFWVVVLLMVPMVFDGFLQLLTAYESGNLRRLLTGTLFGIAFIDFLIYFHRTCVWIAGHLLMLFVQDPSKIEQAMKAFT